jgi:dihydroorotate dehydrogenase
MYTLARRVLFLFSPEWVHYFSMDCLKLLCTIGFKKSIARFYKPSDHGKNFTESLGIVFPNKVGLGAGFDKNAKYLNELEALGFGFLEIGTVTPLPQPGNDKPRLFRLPADYALINRMGFNNDGLIAIAHRLQKWNNRSKKDITPAMVIGGNIGKNKSTPNEEAWKDYEICFRTLYDVVDYFVVNVSSPNTPGLRELQEKESLKKILSHLQTIRATYTTKKPLLLKIAPDLSPDQLDDVIDLAMEIKLDGLVASNTTINKKGLRTSPARLEKIGNGGLSGQPLKNRSTEIVGYIWQRTKGQLPIIASGGIFTAEDALEKMNAGASLVQVWTGFIYEGPSIVKNICKKLKG